jgi:hypothetical protein
MSRRNGSWFEVDRRGLAEIAKRRGMSFIITEPIQNAWDEATTRVEVEMTAVPGAPKVDLVVRDDSPDGFRDLADSYMMFRTSYKLANPEQRGRFNVGEKLLLAVADEARIESTTGSVIFGPNGRTSGRKKTAAGTVLTARLRMTREELAEAIAFSGLLIPPVTTVVNGRTLPARDALAESERYLWTEDAGPDGGFVSRYRAATVRIFPTFVGERPHLYEMGIPVDEVECAWHVEVGQKIPLSVDRSSVRWGYREDVQKIAAEMMAAQMTDQDARAGWASTALGSMEDEDAIRALVKKRFGLAVTYDPSAPESNKLAVDAGYALVHGGELPKEAWAKVRMANALQPAGHLFPDGRVSTSPDGVPLVPPSEWTREMRLVAEYGGAFAEHTIGRRMNVGFYAPDSGPSFMALCGHGMIAFNLGAPDVRDAVEGLEQEALDAILIHECAHDKVGDHLTHAYHRECCRIGARARSLTEGL